MSLLKIKIWFIKPSKELGIKNPLNVPVKKMNKIGPAFARIDLATFTAFGIWLDEKLFRFMQ